MWYIWFNWQESTWGFFVKKSVCFFVKGSIANLLQFFPEVNKNMDKDDVIDKSLDFQDTFDTVFHFYCNFAPVM